MAHKYKSQFQTKIIWPTTTSQNLKRKKITISWSMLTIFIGVHFIKPGCTMGQVAIVDSHPFFLLPSSSFTWPHTLIFIPIRGKPLEQWNPPFFILFHEKWVPPNTRKQLISRSAHVWSMLNLHQTSPLIKKTDWLLGDKKSSKAPPTLFFLCTDLWKRSM